MDAVAAGRPNIILDGGKPSPRPAEDMYVPAVDAELNGETRYSSSFGRWKKSVRSALSAAKSGFGAPKLCGDATGVCPFDLLPNGVRSTLVVSKSSGSALDLSILSRSFVVRRFNFARLVVVMLEDNESGLDRLHTCSGTTPALDGESNRGSPLTGVLDEQRRDVPGE